MTENPSSLVAAPAGFPPLISVVHAEPTPYREATLPQTASTTNPLSYRGMTSSTAAPLTGYTGRYTQPDPINSLLIAQRFQITRRAPDFGYALDNPVLFTDPMGLDVGPKGPCDYYEHVCVQTGCDYPCNVAPRYCQSKGSILNALDTETTKDCIQGCLIESDRATRGGSKTGSRCDCFTCPGKPQCINERCITDYHRTCFMQCRSRSLYPGWFPGPGPAFPGKGC